MRRELLHLVRVLLVLTLLVVFPLAQISMSDTMVSPSSPYSESTKVIDHTPTLQDEKCLTQAIYYEAGNQSVIGKEAVAWVVLNRVGRRGYPKTVCGVIAQSHKVEFIKVCQFSFWCESRRKPERVLWNESQEIAHRVLQNIGNRAILDQYGDATYYHARYVHPAWAKHKIRLGVIEDHIFYREPR